VIVHNTIVGWDWVVTNQGHQLMQSMSRNNLYVSISGGKLFDFQDGVVDSRTDLDYDGFDWAGYDNPFKYDGTQYTDLASFSAATGQETHGVVIDAPSCIPSLDVPAAPPASVPAQWMELTEGCPAVDAGVSLPNVSEDYVGSAPDLGAHELGAEPAHYGPRVEPDDWEDTGADDTDTDVDTEGDTDEEPDCCADPGCGCSSAHGVGWMWVSGLVVLVFRRKNHWNRAA